MDLIDLNTLRSVEELSSYQKEVRARLVELDTEAAGLPFDEAQQEEYAGLKETDGEISNRVTELNARHAYIEGLVGNETRTERVDDAAWRVPKPSLKEADIFDLSSLPQGSGRMTAFQDRAKRALDIATFPHPDANRARVHDHIAKLLDTPDPDDEISSKRATEVAKVILKTGSPTYRKAFGKYLLGAALSTQEQNAMADVQRALSLGTSGFPVVWQLDPTLVPISNFAVNPWRALARSVVIAGTNEWKAVTSAGITAAYAAEATEASDNAPTLAQPDIIVEKAQAYVPFSIEAGQDWAEMQSELAGDLQDAKDVLEATKFALGAGHGSTEPKGVITGATNTTQTTTTGAFVVADVYKIFEALPPRYRPRAQFAANLFIIDKIRQFDTSGAWIGFNQILNAAQDAGGAGTVPGTLAVPLLGRAVHEATAMAATLTTTTKILLVGDFRYFVIVDRVGMNIEVLPLVVGTNHRPTGQRGLYAYWRNSSDVMSAAAFQVLVT